jgi:hypothetical protein
MSEACCAGCGELTKDPKVWRGRTFCPPCLRFFLNQFVGYEMYARRRLGPR